MTTPIIMGKSPSVGIAPSAWANKLAQSLRSRNVPKGLRSALPARCSSDEPLPLPASKTGLRSLTKKRLQSELESRGLEASGNKPALVTRLHKALAAQQQPMQGALAQLAAAQDRPAKANAELLQLRQQVAALDVLLGEVEAALAGATAARNAEQRHVEALQEEMAQLQADWAADREALQDAMDSAFTVAESEEEVRELQALTVQFSERVIRMQTLVQAQDDKIAELKRQLAAAERPAYAMAGAEAASGGGGGGPPTLEQVFAGLGSGEMLMGSTRANTGSMAEAALSASASPSSWPLDGPSSRPGFRTDILQQPRVLGVALAAGTMSAAEAASDTYALVRRLAPPDNRTTVDAAAVATVGGVAALAAWTVSQL